MAFFPCIRFEASILLSFRGQAKQLAKWDEIQKIEYCVKMHEELHQMYELISQLFIIAMRRGIRMIVENPYSKEHYLHRYWCIKPSVIDMNRLERGDYYKKPTQYWFVNCEPKNNLILESVPDNRVGKTVEWVTAKHFEDKRVKSQRVARSMIHPYYANRFIREFILD